MSNVFHQNKSKGQKVQNHQVASQQGVRITLRKQPTDIRLISRRAGFDAAHYLIETVYYVGPIELISVLVVKW